MVKQLATKEWKDTFMTRFQLKNKSALITGAAGLLGVEHAAALLECEAEVILTDKNAYALETATKRLSKIFPKSKIRAFEMDVTNLRSIQGVNKELREIGIEIDILINNAAIDPKVSNEELIAEMSRFENFSSLQWEAELAVGLTGAFYCSQVFGSNMAKTGRGGVILNIASDLSVISPDQRLYRKDGLPEEMQPVKPVTYSVIKAGIVGLTRYLSTYWSHCGVRCNALSPGGVYQGQDPAFVEKVSQLIPMGRMARSDEYRATIQFLCSAASSYMNGQNVIVDGGRSVL